MHTQAIILAGGKGTRMKSDKPKVLHEICGKTMLSYVMDNARNACIEQIAVIVGYGAEEVKSSIAGQVNIFTQHRQLGTGHAVMQALSFIDDNAYVVVLCGDAPLVDSETIQSLCEYTASNKKDAVVVSAMIDDPYGYGRIIRDRDGEFIKIVEQKDAAKEEKKIHEINSGVYCFLGSVLKYALGNISNDNVQGEYYLTDTIELLINEKYSVDILVEKNCDIIKAVNDKKQLAQLEKFMRCRINEGWLEKGVTMIDPDSTYISCESVLSEDVLLYPGVVIEGRSIIKKNCIVTSGSIVKNSIIGEDTLVQNSYITDSIVGSHVKIGPYAHLRPKSKLADHVKIGNFVEVKNSEIGQNSKSSHLTYIGDAKVGDNVNLGCGVVFVNYDGKNKALTVVEDDCFIGCNVNLIAPVTVKKGAYVAAGSTITFDVEENNLAIARCRQTNKENWVKK
jgi:bifunctional UDP-N-acetylglucosamine pyrophosphorylase/glucosamine-1-phosphate N-acetyltransferase